jgi:hypothetical protein
MFNALTTRIGLTLRLIAGHLRDVARAVLRPDHRDDLQALWRRGGLLQPFRARVRHDADRS